LKIIARKTSQKAAKSEREMRHLKQMQTLEAQLTAMQESLSRTVRENESVAESVNFQNEENKERIAELERCCESVRNELVAMQTQHTKEAQRTASLRVHLRDTEAEARRDMAGLLETIRAQQGQLLNQRHEIEILTEKVGELVSAKSIIEGDVRPIMMENAALRRCISRIEPGRDASNPVPILMQMPNYLTLAIKDRAQCNYSTDYAKDASDGQIEAPKLD
jgi:chromosome segregation ATPase